MTQRTRIKPVPILILIPTVFLLVTSVVHFAEAGRGVILRPPFDGTYRVTAYFDHQNPNYAGDNYIWIYNGERVSSSLANHTGEPYPYDGHDGWDWSMSAGTHILAAAAGTVVVSTDDWGGANSCYGHTIVINHGNNYYTQYSHLSQLLVGVGASVVAGQHIAESGNSTGPNCQAIGAHLHFGVRHGGYDSWNYAIDPFGWHGTQRDPLFNYNNQESSCLWRSLDVDPVSCADTIVEDAGRGSTIVGAWNVSTAGNGYHMYYRNNTADNTVQASWLTTSTVAGIYKVYAYIPSQNATTHHASYQIWTTSGWQTSVVTQHNYSDAWVSLGTYQLPANMGYVILSANTGEIAGTTLVAADAIKFRSYLDYLPLILKQPTPTPTSTPTPTPTPTATPPPVAQCGQNALHNEGFEWGLPGTPWQQYSSGGRQLISTYRSRSGSWGAWLGGYDSALDKLYQGYTIPSGATQATLEFWWYMTSDEPTTTSYDYLEWTLQSPPGNDLSTRGRVSNRWPRGTWSKATSVYPWMGPWVDLPMWVDFEAKTDGSTATHFFIDDVSLVIQCGGVSGNSTGGTLTSPLATPTPHR